MPASSSRSYYKEFYQTELPYSASTDERETLPRRQSRGRSRGKTGDPYRSRSQENITDVSNKHVWTGERGRSKQRSVHEVQRRAVSEGRQYGTMATQRPRSNVSTFRNILPESATRYMHEEKQKKQKQKVARKTQKKKQKTMPGDENQMYHDENNWVLKRKMYIPPTRSWFMEDTSRNSPKSEESDFVWPEVPENENLSRLETTENDLAKIFGSLKVSAINNLC